MSPGRVRNGDAALGRAASATGKPITRLNPLPHQKFSRDRPTHLHETTTLCLTVLIVTLLFPIEILSPCRSLFSHSPSSSSSLSAKRLETFSIDYSHIALAKTTSNLSNLSRLSVHQEAGCAPDPSYDLEGEASHHSEEIPVRTKRRNATPGLLQATTR
jgi:hypothetical protein